MLKKMKNIISGLVKCFRARGLGHTLKLVFLHFVSGRLGLWIDGNTMELLFWEKQAIGIGSFSDNFQEKVDLQKQKNRFPKELSCYLEDQRKKLGSIPRVLDVGCGPVSLLASAHHHGVIRLTATDILADSYKALLIDYGHENSIAGIELVNSAAEFLTVMLPGKEFDLAYCNNALDHTNSPRQSFEQMVALVKQGGYIIVSGNEREGTNEQWDGIHMHDLYIEDGGLYREGKSGERMRLDEGLPVKILFSSTSADIPVGKMFIVYEKL